MDIKTILICLFIINLFLGLFVYAIKKTQTTFPGINFWIVSNIFIAIAYLLLFLRSSIPDSLSIVLANTLFLLAFIVRIYGLKRFFNQNYGYLLHGISLITLTSFLILFIFFTYQQNNVFIRTLVSGTFLSGSATIIGFLILKNKSEKNSFSYIFTASVFFLFSIIFLSRVIGWILFPDIRNLFTSVFINQLQFFSNLAIDITWTTMFFVMHNQKLTYELANSEEKYRSTYDNSFSGILLINEEGKYFDVNPTFTKITGYTLSEMIEKQIGTITYGEDQDKIRNILQNMYSKTTLSLKDQIRVVHKNGNIVWIQINANKNFDQFGNFKYILVEIFDITIQKTAELNLIKAKEEIELQNERLESLLRISQFQTNSIQELLDFALEEAIELTNSKIGYIYFYNETTRQFILNTWSKDVMKECAVQNPQTVYDLDSTGCWGEAVRQKRPIVLNDYQSEDSFKKGIPEGHVKLKKFLTIPVFSDDKIVAVAGVANKLTDYDNSDIRQLTLLMDNVWKISERLTLIDHLKKAKERAENSEKDLSELNTTKDKLFSIIAHDLKSPFSAILGFSDILSNEIKNQDVAKSEKIINYISSSAKNTLNLLNNLLSWAKSQTGQLSFKPELLSLSEIVKPIIDEQNLIAKIKNISIHANLSDEVTVYCDYQMLETIIRNLISNAIKYSYPDGKIDFFAIKKEKYIEISVSDYGVGMNKEIKDKLFIVGEQESLEGTTGEKGTGLGLILCKDFVEKHGGKIWVESEPEKGSKFYFTLPNKKSD